MENLIFCAVNVSAFYENLQCWAIALCQVFSDISPDIMKDVFHVQTITSGTYET